MEPRYNRPNLSPEQFLYEVLHSPDVAVEDRIRAAAALAEIERLGLARPTLVIQIPNFPDAEELRMWVEYEAFSREQRAYFKTLPKAEQDEIMRVLRRLERCNSLGIGPLDITSEVKGHA